MPEEPQPGIIFEENEQKVLEPFPVPEEPQLNIIEDVDHHTKDDSPLGLICDQSDHTEPVPQAPKLDIIKPDILSPDPQHDVVHELKHDHQKICLDNDSILNEIIPNFDGQEENKD